MMPRDPSEDDDRIPNADDGSLRIVEVNENTDDVILRGPAAVSALMQAAKIEPRATSAGGIGGPAPAPARTRKIAILGTAPQWQAAPFDDPSWEIWGIFGVTLVAKRLDRLYELHHKAIIEPMVKQYSPDGKYWDICRKLGANFITKDAFAEAPESTRFDFDSKIKKYGKYFASSASWLLAEALDQNPAEIGIFGVNMAADEEYAHQKPSLSYLIGWGKSQGVQFHIPSSSELMSLTHMYGIEDQPRFAASLAQRRHEVQQQLAIFRSNELVAKLQCANCEGAMQQLQWIEQNFKS